MFERFEFKHYKPAVAATEAAAFSGVRHVASSLFNAVKSSAIPTARYIAPKALGLSIAMGKKITSGSLGFYGFMVGKESPFKIVENPALLRYIKSGVTDETFKPKFATSLVINKHLRNRIWQGAALTAAIGAANAISEAKRYAMPQYEADNLGADANLGLGMYYNNR